MTPPADSPVAPPPHRQRPQTSRDPIRLGPSREGGWRIVRGQLPVGPAAALTLAVPAAGTEIGQSSLADRASFETKAADEKIETALGNDGRLDLQWRPKVMEGMVDQALTVQSTAILDVREDALRLVWQVKLDFGRGRRRYVLSADARRIPGGKRHGQQHSRLDDEKAARRAAN